ncbi:glycogen operon protein GlgX homolog [Aureimonas endophytica]|uniref:Glycogen operon protein GlgX homolog n=1 Tax=Aureimonas endophytica TaxID=2027858 RepID=A0A917E4D8_9HYPH|nr:glycogen debranching protein GlgX [Aureimonas endophytica]GGD99683.1 glycogen operon protein GlgX homolog [Aureimonas endophytica]
MATLLTAERGLPAELGATVTEDGVHFAVYSENADEVQLCLFDEFGTRETERLRLPGRDGNVRFGFAPGMAAGARYGFRARGPFDPARGHRFDASKLLVDPYARRLDRAFVWRPELAAPPSRGLDSGPFVPRALALPPETGARPLPFAPPGFTYELLVRGFSQSRPDLPVRLRGTVAALCEAPLLDHLTRLGVETVELMPLAASLDERHLAALGLTNAWGYNPIALMAPDPRLAPGGFPEIRAAVEALHHRGIRVLLDVVLNHSGESDEFGPTIAFRGLDNALYYRHAREDAGRLVNDTGTGNTFAADRAPVVRLFRDTLRRWVEETGLDGFRYDLGTVLGREDTGFSRKAPFFAMVAEDAVLKDRIHVAEPWDIGPGGYQVGNFPPPFLEWQDRFRDDVRRFWRGDAGMVGALATRLAGSADLFATDGRRPSAGVNFLAAHDGFTLADLVAYAGKHNEANGENNRDGHNDNHSWNNGAEGETGDPAILEARARDVRALLATLFVARGNPMLTAGDELGRTQRGNNNAYAQDNEITWIDWPRADRELVAFVGRLAGLRRTHPALARDAFLTGEPVTAGAARDAVWRREDGEEMEVRDWQEDGRRVLALDLTAPDGDGRLARALVYLNAGREEVLARLPETKTGFVLELRSDRPDAEPVPLASDHPLVVPARAVLIVVET